MAAPYFALNRASFYGAIVNYISVLSPFTKNKSGQESACSFDAPKM